MRIPIKWLKEFIEFKGSSTQLAQVLTLSGTAIEGIESANGSEALIAEITTNRPDCLSLLGIAQEVAALSGKKVKLPQGLKAKSKAPLAKNKLPLDVKIVDKINCPAYTARVFSNVELAESSKDIVDKLSWMNQQSINNIVDITNICLFEIGQPLHAFDYDKIKGNQIIIRCAKKGEKLLALNDVEYTLDENVTVIADAEKPIAIAGIIGGKNSQVTWDTKNIVLESARFNAVKIRRTSKSLKVSTDSSYRFERTVDAEKMLLASNRAAYLIQSLASGLNASKLIMSGGLKSGKASTIRLSENSIHKVLGFKLSLAEASRILKGLGLGVSKAASKAIRVKPPSSRLDLQKEIDLIEEVIRIHGFDKIPTKIPDTRYALKASDRKESFNLIRNLKQSLVSQGMWEAITLNLLSSDTLKQINYPQDKPVLKIKNPLSKEQESLSPHPLVGLLNVLAHNYRRQEGDLQFFEMTKKFENGKEIPVLAIVMTGMSHEAWNGNLENNFYRLKGIVENVYQLFSKEIPPWKEENSLPETFSNALSLYRLASLGEVKKSILSRWGVEHAVYYAEVNLHELFNLLSYKVIHQDLPKYPAVRRDIAIVVDETIPAEKLERALWDACGKSLTQVRLFDEYKGKTIPKGKRSLAFSLRFQKSDGTFTESEITAISTKALESLKNHYHCELR